MYYDNDHIIEQAHKLIREAGTSDPASLADYLDISVKPVPFRKQKWVYQVIEDIPFIFIKEDLAPEIYNIVILHEIGHDRLHRDIAKAFAEYDLFDMQTSRMEYEANLFAAEISLPDDEILDYIYQGMDVSQIARAMYSDINLVALKASDMIRRGYNFNQVDHRNDFLK
jgi:Zn-dependent peptidase ImmA (M78 family)